MLGKLIRYDSKIQMKFYGGVYMVMGVVALLAALLTALQRRFEYAVVFQYGHQVSWLFCRAASVVLVIGSIIYAVAFFRRNLFKDEGYFMHTLPVPAWQLLVSKLITCTIWIWISICVAILGYMMGGLDFSFPLWEVIKAGGMTDTSVFYVALPTLILAIPATLIQFYVSIVIGYTWKMHGASVDRDILSVVALVITYTIQQAASVVALLVYLVVRSGSIFSPYFAQRLEAMFNSLNEANSTEFLLSYAKGIFGISTVEMVLLGGAFLALSIWKMSRHLNME